MSSAWWHCCSGSNNKCPDSVCHVKIDSPKPTARWHNVDITVMYCSCYKNKFFNPRYHLPAAYIDFMNYLWFPLNSPPFLALFEWSQSDCCDKANKYNQSLQRELFGSGAEGANSETDILIVSLFLCGQEQYYEIQFTEIKIWLSPPTQLWWRWTC